MANEIQFYQTDEDLPTTKTDGNIYFLLKDSDKTADIKIDLEGERYTVKSEIPVATSNKNGLFSSKDKEKIDLFNAEITNSQINIDTGNKDINLIKNLTINNSKVLTANSFNNEIAVSSITTTEENPSGNVSYNSNTNKWDFSFKIPRGSSGKNGENGKSLRINAIEITTKTDSENTTPRLICNNIKLIESDEDNYDPNYNTYNIFLTAYNIKGDQGDQGPRGIVPEFQFDFLLTQNDTISSDPPFTDDDGIIHYKVYVPKGEKGDKGDSGISSITLSGNGNAVSSITGEKNIGENGEYTYDLIVNLNKFISLSNDLSSNEILIGNTGTTVNQIENAATGVLRTTGINSAPSFGTASVSDGGTGLTAIPLNSVLLGNETSNIKTKSSANGAFYSTGNNEEPSFGTLQVAQGGTGSTSLRSKSVLLGNGTSAIDSVSNAAGAFYSDGSNKPLFGKLPIDKGGTNATSIEEARSNLGIVTPTHTLTEQHPHPLDALLPNGYTDKDFRLTLYDFSL